MVEGVIGCPNLELGIIRQIHRKSQDASLEDIRYPVKIVLFRLSDDETLSLFLE